VNKKGAYYKYLNRTGWLYITPAMIFYGVFMLYPILSSLTLVTSKVQGFNKTFIGFGNFIRMFNDLNFWISLRNNFLFMFIQIPIMIMLALILAVILDRGIKRFQGTFRTIYFLPCVSSLVAYAVLFRILLQSNGLLNNLLISTKVISTPITWLNDPFWAKVTIIVALTWRWTGYNMVLFLVGLQNIDSQLYEAADIDGASDIRQFFQITIPLLVPMILFSAVTSTSGTMQLFDEPSILTFGGDTNASMTLALYVYRQAFILNSDFGYAASISYVIVLISAILAFIQIKLLGEKNQ
jgi:lactose/L-arabinose transport system permease protein